MSQENVERLRQALDANRLHLQPTSGTSQFDTEAAISVLAELWDPEIEWDASESPLPDLAEVYRRIEAVRRYWLQFLSAWEFTDFNYELVDAGNRVVMLLNQRMRGRTTGIEVPTGKYAQVATFKDRRMVHWKLYISQSDALVAVGLSE
jgi:SnoaL-like domain